MELVSDRLSARSTLLSLSLSILVYKDISRFSLFLRSMDASRSWMLEVSLMIDDDGVIDQKYLKNKNIRIISLFFFLSYVSSMDTTSSISVSSLNDYWIV